ncbi:MAG: hypothetical protein QW057_04365, partial [Candidatus Bathyarchaeia archaeon]
PRGAGKSTLMLLVLRGLYGEGHVVISGASEVKRGEVIGRLHIPSLEKDGVERVLWAAFTKTGGKGLDEVNRLNPYTTANIHHMMQFGEVWAYGQKSKIGDYTIVANENPSDPSTFAHPPPFYDRFDICVHLRSLTLSEKFELQAIIDKHEGDVVDSMPQVLSQEELEQIRREVKATPVSSDIAGLVNILVRDFQACVRNREQSELKPPALCEGCHFIRDACARVREPPSERAAVVLMELAKAITWLNGQCRPEDIQRVAEAALSHRISLVATRNSQEELRSLLRREWSKMADREARRQWPIMNYLLKQFDRGLYQHAKEISMEDIVFAEELLRLETRWLREGAVKREETLEAVMGWR